MSFRSKPNILSLIAGIFILVLFASCSNRQNTAVSRAYHSINTRYNIHFNAQIAYNEALESKYGNMEENLSEILHIYPDNSDTTEIQPSGRFTTTIDKTTKAIKMHSIKTKPKRDRSKMQDAQYKAWTQQKEFNPFLYNTWMLLAKAEFEDGNYLRAVTTFMYISKIYSGNDEIVAECKLWSARAYTEMGWMYEAENVLRKMDQVGKTPQRLLGFYSTVKANYYIRNEQYEEAIPYLVTAIEKQKRGLLKTRMRYLLGQVYGKMGERDKAYEAFKSVKGMNTPYKYIFNADLNQIALSSLSMSETLKRFEKMASQTKNEEYLDRIYTIVGDKYIQDRDTLKAIEYYKKAIEESKKNGYDKAIAQIALGDIYFQKREFIPAQPNYSAALAVIKKNHTDYPRVYFRSSILDELVVHAKVVHEQDSLQHLARLPESERLAVINVKIKEIRDKEEKEKKEKELQERLENEKQETTGAMDWNSLSKDNLAPNVENKAPAWQTQQQGAASTFYFYNKQTIEQGKIAFQKKWGNRKLEDDWRRKNKSVSLFGGIVEDETTDVDDESVGGESVAAAEDKYSPEYYLQQLPLTEEAIKASNVLIESGLYNMGKIYKEKLEDLSLAIEAFSANVNRFPNNPHAEDVYYQLFLIYMQLGNKGMMANYRNKIIAEFPDGEYAIPLSDPNYEWNFRNIALMQGSMYEEAYNAYLAGDVNTVRNNYTSISKKYPFIDLMPKFSLLNALSYAQTKDINNLSKYLKELIEKYPKSDVVPLATDILERIVDGGVLLSDGTPIRSLDWSKAFVGEDEVQAEEGAVLEYKDTPDTDYVLLLSFKAKSVDRNELLYQVADYNFSNYVVQVHDLSFQADAFTETLQIRGFKKLASVRTYINKGFAEEGLFHFLDKEVSVLPISLENQRLLPRLGMEAYQAFFEQHYAEQMPALITYWKTRTIEIPDEEAILEAEAQRLRDIKAKEKEAAKPVDTELAGEKVVLGEGDIAIDRKVVDSKNKEDKREINLEDILSEDQVEAVGKVNDVIESAGEVISNPVDGMKSIFNKLKKKDNLSKEEKAQLKEEEKCEKERLKAERSKAKAVTDSVAKSEQMVQDSIQRIEDDRLEQERAVVQAKKDEGRALQKAKEDALRQKEQERKDTLRRQQDLRQQRVKDQEERRKTKEQERKEKLKAREEERKAKIKEQEERRKEQDKKRK